MHIPCELSEHCSMYVYYTHVLMFLFVVHHRSHVPICGVLPKTELGLSQKPIIVS